jgi:hypothetical protein
MPTLIHPSGITKEVPVMTVGDARREGFLPEPYVPVEKDPAGYNNQLKDSDVLRGRYSVIPRNRAG